MNLKRASFTVEAALVLPPVLAAMLLLLYLLTFAHNRSVYTSAALTQSITGREQDVSTFYLSRPGPLSAQEDDGARTVTGQSELLFLPSGRSVSFSVHETYRKTDAPDLLRKRAALRDLSGRTS